MKLCASCETTIRFPGTDWIPLLCPACGGGECGDGVIVRAAMLWVVKVIVVWLALRVCW